MNTQQLHCFLCVSDKLNFTRAAEDLYLSTPTVSHHIQNLEAELNTKLFIRNKRSVRLTEAGLVFYKDAKDIMDKLNIAKQHVDKMNEKHFSILRIGCSSTMELERLNPILACFHQDFPTTFPQITVTDYSHLMNMLYDNQLEIVFGTSDMMKDVSGYSFQAMHDMTSKLIVPTSHPLSKKKQLSLDDLHEDTLLTLHPRMVPFQYGNVVQGYIRAHFESHLDIVCENDQACLTMASAGYGIAILPEFCLPLRNTDEKIAIIPLLESKTIAYGVAYHNKGKQAALSHFLALCKKI